VSLRSGVLLGNVGARLGGLACLFVATLVVARAGGPALVGAYALLHLLPALVGTLVSCGLVMAATYFLAGANRDDARLPATIVAIALVAGVVGTLLWVLAAPALQALLFKDLSVLLVALAGVAVLTRLVVTTAKSCCQGTNDLQGSNAVILAEDLMFLPAFALLSAAGLSGNASVVVGLLIADVATGSFAWARLWHRGFFRGAASPSHRLARRIASYGMRAQIGTIMSQLNLRLDFVLLSVLAGPAVLGVYAIGSKFAELTRVVGMSITYVLYPQFARVGSAQAIIRARRLLPAAGATTAALAVVLGVVAGFVIPAFYGAEFDAAVTPARIILLGLALDGAAAVLVALLFGIGRPGRNSLAMGAGLIVTVVLDVVLIPPYAEIGAAIASASAYATTTLALLLFWRLELRQLPSRPRRRLQRLFSSAS
jgi:O-antigen/teichoic acid export membrane protein